MKRGVARSGAKNRVKIRLACETDLDRALEMELEGFSFYPLGRRQLRYHIANPNAVFLVAELGGEVVGDAIGLVRSHGKRVSGRVYSLVVDGAHRGQGIGGNLFEWVVRELEARGAGRVFLEVAEQNHGAIRIYERFGFRNVGRLKDYYARGQHAIHMLYERKAGRVLGGRGSCRAGSRAKIAARQEPRPPFAHMRCLAAKDA